MPEYFTTKSYLVSSKEKLVLPLAFKSAVEAIDYSKLHNLRQRGYNVVMKGSDVRRLLASGRISEPTQDRGAGENGRKVPQVLGAKFPLGMTVMTAGVAARVAEDPAFAAYMLESLKRHANGDWGDLCEEDKKENEYSLDKRLRLFSAYEGKGMPKIWIITEASRDVTTTLFPDEY